MSGFLCVALIYFFFIVKCEPLNGETLIEIESAVAKQKKSEICFVSESFLPQSKGYIKKHFEFSYGINIIFIYSNSP